MVNNINKKVYIGIGVGRRGIAGRFADWRRAAKYNNISNHLLAADVKQYGLSSFSFHVIFKGVEWCTKTVCAREEKRQIHLVPAEKRYNIMDNDDAAKRQSFFFLCEVTVW